MTLLKRITLGLIALVAIIAVVGVFAVSHLDLTRQKDRIELQVYEKTGRELQINGDLNATVFPWLGLSLSDVHMGDAEEFSDSEFAAVDSIKTKVAFIPLLTGNIEIEKIALDGLSLRLQRNADGKTNWDDLMAASAVVETESDDNVMREIEAGAPIVAALSVGDVQINNASISYTDGRDESYLAFNDLNLNTGTIVLSEPFAFDSDFNFISSAASGLISVVSAKGEVAIDLVNNIFVLQQLKLSTVNSGDSLPLDPLPLSLNGELVADFTAKSMDITVVDGLLTGVPVRGEFHAIDWHDNLQLTGELKSDEFDAMPFVDRFELLERQQFPVELLQKSRVSARFEHSEDLLQIREFTASVSDVEINGDFQIANPSGSGVLSGWIQTNPFNPAPWAQSFGWDIPENSVMRLAQVSSDVRQSGQLLSFNQIDFQLDESNITGSIEISDINAEQLPITFAVSVDSIELDNYVAAVLSPLRDGESRQIPVDALRRLTIDGEIAVEEITVSGIKAQNAVIPFEANNGKLTITEATANLYAGSFFSTASLDVQAEEPLLTVTGNMNGLHAQELLQDFLRDESSTQESALAGIANLSVDLLLRGNHWSRLLEHANGAVTLRVTDGQLRGIDILALLRSNGQLAEDSATDAPVTRFSEYSVSALLSDGLVKSDDLMFVSPSLQLTGEGGVNLRSGSMDYLLHLLVIADPQAEQDNTVQNLTGIELAIPLTGSLFEQAVNQEAGSLRGVNDFITREFQSALQREIEAFNHNNPASDSRKAQITAEKEALRLRLEAEQQNSAATTPEPREGNEIPTEEMQRQLELEREKNALKEKLKSNLKDNLNGLLGEN